MTSRIVWTMGLAALTLVPSRSGAQQNFRVEVVRTADGRVLDYPIDGVWRVRARQVRAARARLLALGRFSELNAAPSAATAVCPPTVLCGVMYVPTVLLAYSNTDTTTLPRAIKYDSLYNTSVPLAGHSYSVRSYYEEVSNGLFSAQGNVFGWVRNANPSGFFLDACGSGSDPLTCFQGFIRLRTLFVGALTALDPTVNFGLYDNDGPDGIPNSGDDDGVVDDVRFVQPTVGSECGGSGYGAHHYSLAALGGFYTTQDAWAGHAGAFIRVNSYHIVSGVGGPFCRDSTQIGSVGTPSHELGHGLDLPDLYDVSLATKGIGEFGIMGSGNYASLNSPTHQDAWSKQQLGWVTVRPLTAIGTYTLDPVETAHTVDFMAVQGGNPRGEYFLLENRQALLADTANMLDGGLSGNPKGGGLLVWHIDSIQACLVSSCGNQVNVGPIHGVALEEADGLGQLWTPNGTTNRGDNGDPYPGVTDATAFSSLTLPRAITNADSSFVGFAIDSIRQLVPNGAMSYRLRFGALTLVQASDTTAKVKVDGIAYNVFGDLFDDGSSHTIAVDTPQFSPSGRTRFSFVSWSDAGAMSHAVTGALAGASYTATLARAHRLNVAAGPAGTIDYNPPADTNGTFVPEGTPVTLTATPTPPALFGGWTGDTVTANPVLTLPMGRPYAVTAHFDPELAITSGDPRPGGIMGKAYADTLRASGGSGTLKWLVVAGRLPASLALDSVNGRITGFPTETGTFSFTVRVTSGAQQAQQSYGIAVVAPTLVKPNVVEQLLNASGALTLDEIRYLDLNGNRTCGNDGTAVIPPCFDVGDFLAWVQATGAVPAPPHGAVAGKGGRP